MNGGDSFLSRPQKLRLAISLILGSVCIPLGLALQNTFGGALVVGGIGALLMAAWDFRRLRYAQGGRSSDEFHVVFGHDGPERVSRDDFAESMWPYREKSPEWYAARMAHNIGALGPDKWADKPDLHRWLRQVVAILEQPDLVKEYQRDLLSAEELAAVKREEADIEEHGW